MDIQVFIYNFIPLLETLNFISLHKISVRKDMVDAASYKTTQGYGLCCAEILAFLIRNMCLRIDILFHTCLYMKTPIFSRPTSLLQKSSCRVSSEKNILNSSVESCGVEKLDKSYIFVYFLTHFLFIINTVIRGAHDN